MQIGIKVIVCSRIGFASHQNAAPVIRELIIQSSGDIGAENCSLYLRSDPPFLAEKTWYLDRIRPQSEVVISDRNVKLNGTLLSGLTEALSSSVTFSLVDAEGKELASVRYEVELLAHNEWGGIGAMADLAPAFVMPNDPAVDKVLKAASDCLRRSGKPDAINGYDSKERTRVWQLAAAIWSAVAGMRLSYALPPASFERHGQKIRTPSQILDGKMATCLDTALLFAAALEQASLNPLLIFIKEHAFVGVWLQPSEFSSLITDEAAALRRRFTLDELIVFETTLVTQANPPSFSQAITAGYAHLDERKDDEFYMAIDIRRGRMQKIRPLGVALAARAQEEDVIPVSEALEEAPSLPSFETEAIEEVVTPAGRVRQWQRKLLNLTTANRLLHLSDSAKAVHLFCPDPARLEDLLASDKKIRIKPMPDLETAGRDEALYNQQTTSNLRKEIGLEALDRGETLALLPKEKLDAQLVDLYRKAKSDIDEGGANTLFLAIGFLKWKKSEKETKTYRAPLILLPVKLDRKSALSGVVMSQHEDEPRFNLTLLELLRQDFELTIPKLEGSLPTDASGIDVPQIWRLVRDAVKDMAGFEVVPDVVLGTFSFAKYLMWKDLVDRQAKLQESPLVRHLIERDGKVRFDVDQLPRVEHLDKEVSPADLFAPLPADSSQLRAVVASARGVNFVLDGPPGTGKSQTIANMIAHNLALGRRVLFVAEKRAALDVVHRRLTDKGLAPFCLELHSAKATKSAVLRQLEAAWDTRDTLTAAQWEKEANEAKVLRDRLNETVSLLHRQEANGYTIHQAIGRYIRDGGENTVKFAFLPGTRHTLIDMERMRDVARRLGIARRDVTDLPADLGGVMQLEWSNGWQEQIVASALSLPPVLDEFERAVEGLASASNLPSKGSQNGNRLLELAELCLSLHGQDFRFAFAPDFAGKIDAARKALVLIESYRDEEAALSTAYAPEVARRLDLEGLLKEWTQAGAKFWFLATLAKRKVARTLAQSGGAAGKVEPESDLCHLVSMRALLEQVDGLTLDASAVPGWQGLASKRVDLEAAIGRAETLRQTIASQADGADELITLRSAVANLVVDANELLSADSAIARGVARLRRAYAQLSENVSTFERLCRIESGADFKTLRTRAQAVTAQAQRLRDWTNWQRVRAEAVQLELVPLVVGLEQNLFQSAETLAAFETAYARWFAFHRMDSEPLLRDFMPGEHTACIERFRQIDDRMSALASQYIRAKICGNIPAKADVAKNSGFGALRHQLQLQRPSKPIRQLAGDMGEAFTKLAPCMLMSPLSIAQYLPPDQALFDIVIFDEASQITPWDAIGVMARGKQVIIAGDPRQMPPSSNFERQGTTANDDDDTEEDMESILDECLGAGVPQINLDWHYRSRHESLITFSNVRYYGNRLVTFPAPDTRPSAVKWRRVDGVFAKGKERTNAIEAQAIVDTTVHYLLDPNFVDEKGRPLSLGIITMNAPQMSLVERLLDVARQKHPEIERHFSDDLLEPVCVRNLETAQGDERDIILLGVSFGPTEPNGKTMSMNFGKLNPNGGWRRLNVAVTRARREMQIFTSFDPGMIDLTRTSADGVRDLKAFIDFAHRGNDALASADRGSQGGYDSPFEEAVADELRRRGWRVVTQVGVSKFRIDLGIVHPDLPGDFVLGVECDGATYHSAATARDRDKVRGAILEGLGWKLLRVWSTEWWFNKARAADQLHEAIVQALEASRVRRAESKALPAPANDNVDIDTLTEPDIGVETGDQSDDRTALFAGQTLATGGEVLAYLPSRSEGGGGYTFTEFGHLSDLIKPDEFHDDSYYPTLQKLIDCVVALEGPIAEGQLVKRIARAHNFQRAGGRIHNRVMDIARDQHYVTEDGGPWYFVWSNRQIANHGVVARFPASDKYIRQIEDIAKAELKAVGSDDPVEIARLFGVRRLSASARARIEAALAGI
jgi:very-short-patch-repair endonuclease